MLPYAHGNVPLSLLGNQSLMPFISDIEVKERLDSPDNLVNRTSNLKILPLPSRGRTATSTEMPKEIQNVISDLAGSGESNKSLALAFGVSPTQVSELKNGKRCNHEVIPGIQKTIDKNKGRREEAESRAIDSLLTALDLIPSKLNGAAKLKDISAAAKDMASVAEKMRGSRDDSDRNATVHLHIYAPPMKQVEDYEVIDA